MVHAASCANLRVGYRSAVAAGIAIEAMLRSHDMHAAHQLVDLTVMQSVKIAATNNTYLCCDFSMLLQVSAPADPAFCSLLIFGCPDGMHDLLS